ncbi:MAG: hypothetical protein JW751_30675 [Polyangiaceae bacterium]|nr:hypothetical protein [Polyangiaceae bacterium]
MRALLYDQPTSEQKERRRRAVRVGRLLRLLRAHGILKKGPRTHRSQFTTTVRQALAAMFGAADDTTAQLARLAAGPKASSLRSRVLERIVLSHDDSRR